MRSEFAFELICGVVGYLQVSNQFEMAPSVSVNVISLVTSCIIKASEGGATNTLPGVLYMGVSYSR